MSKYKKTKIDELLEIFREDSKNSKSSKRLSTMSEYEIFLNEIKKSVKSQTDYNIVLKTIEDEIMKCQLSQKKIREAIEPIIKQIADSEEEYDDLMRLIPSEYQRRYNAKTETMLIENDMFGAFVRIKNAKGKGWKKDGSFITTEHSVLPQYYQLKEQADLNIKYDITCGKDCFTITKNNMSAQTRETTDERINTNTPQFWGTYYARDVGLEADFWNWKRFNGVEEIWDKMKEGKISRKECNRKIRDIYIKEAHKQGENATLSLNQGFQRNGVPMESYFGRIE